MNQHTNGLIQHVVSFMFES